MLLFNDKPPMVCMLVAMILYIMALPPITTHVSVAALERKRNFNNDNNDNNNKNRRCGVHPSGIEVCEGEDAWIDEGDEDDEDEEDDDDCEDNHEYCPFWSTKGECSKNPNYMKANCRKSCGICSSSNDKDSLFSPEQEMEMNTILDKVAKYGEPQKASGTEKSQTLKQIRETISYMENFVFAENPTHKLTPKVTSTCLNRDKLCSFWASLGECDNNKAFMTTNCAPSCKSCHLIEFATRCPPRKPHVKPGLNPGELNQMFQNIVNISIEEANGQKLHHDTCTTDTTSTTTSTTHTDTEHDQEQEQEQSCRPPSSTSNFNVQVHSRPLGIIDIPLTYEQDMNQDPWVITIDNFLTHQECDDLIQIGYDQRGGYKRSKDVGHQNFDGSFEGKTSLTRTSENSWCSDRDGCRSLPLVQQIHQRIQNITGIPQENSEDFQILKYEVGQFYRTHHDYIEHQTKRACGPRILTFFLYLSDVEEGGGTGFPDLNELVITPKKGMALLWPSVLNHDPSKKDPRTIHEAQEVRKGTKFAANGWIHLYNYIEPQKSGCT